MGRSPRWKNRRREERRAEAEKRQAAAEGRTAKQQLKRLERRGHGHCAEAVRLRESL